MPTPLAPNVVSYVVLRGFLWIVLGAAVLIDYLRNRQARPKGWQLHRFISAVIGIFVVHEFVTLCWAISNDNGGLYKALIFFYGLADSAFLAVLLLVSCGWCITRTSLEKYIPVIVLPIIRFVCRLVSDYILEVESGHRADPDPSRPIYIENKFEREVLILTTFFSEITLFCSWYWILASTGEETERLTKKISNRNELPMPSASEGAEPELRRAPIETNQSEALLHDLSSKDRTSTAPRDASLNADDDSDVWFDAMPQQTRSETARPQHPVNPLIENKPLSPIPPGERQGVSHASDFIQPHPTNPFIVHVSDSAHSDLQGDRRAPPPPEIDADQDEDTSMPDKAKLTLLTRFSFLVQTYLLAVIIILFITAYNKKQYFGLTVLMDFVTFLAMAALAYIFRLRPMNPYFLLQSYQEFDDGTEGDGNEREAVQMHALPTPSSPFEYSPNSVFASQPGVFRIDDGSDDEEDLYNSSKSRNTQSNYDSHKGFSIA